MRRHTDVEQSTTWWVIAVERFGVPAAIAGFLVWFITSGISATISETNREVKRHTAETVFYLRAICLNTAKSDADRLACVEVVHQPSGPNR